ncbi:hypothetical protein PILCRDRAFT_14825 [Piloderma croceum F 1598]|uniref:Uncharacterized protein n=1 Tax=Piloderma croceum (strain F 1598) TaxID=765440 RepID=A0A0C3EMU8_PILCF|nr:hypothetical protein PILCRDRAFT_14825 [Piloderma croceum F 1598]
MDMPPKGSHKEGAAPHCGTTDDPPPKRAQKKTARAAQDASVAHRIRRLSFVELSGYFSATCSSGAMALRPVVDEIL